MTLRPTISRLDALDDAARHLAAIDAIFFQSSSIRNFASEAERVAFRERWLSRYLDAAPPRWVYVACAPDGECVGYLVGAVDDPAQSARFADIGYFRSFAALTRLYPAHLHVNVASSSRNHGIGTDLIEAFAADIAGIGVAGVHVVTGAGARNVAFYRRAGFREKGTTDAGSGVLVFMARHLDPEKKGRPGEGGQMGGEVG